jgi:hypothetical protein
VSSRHGAAASEATWKNASTVRLMARLLGLLAHDLRNPALPLQSNVNFIGGAAFGADPEIREAVADASSPARPSAMSSRTWEILGQG